MDLVGTTVGGVYRVEGPLTSGSFGDVYKGRDMKTNESVAIKIEAMDARHPQLRYEAKLYESFSGAYGVPNIRWFGTERSFNANVLVFDLLGPSLQDLLDSCDGRFSLKTVLLLADQMINRLEWLHSKSLLHRDIKPENFAMGVGDKANVVHMIDFGLSKKFRDKNLEHIPYREGKRMIGTLRYASLRTHMGIEQGRRDDLESLGYVLMYFLRGSLPWQGMPSGDSKTRNMRCLKCKMSTPIETLCNGFPNEFSMYLQTCKDMHFQDKPDYAYLKDMLRAAFLREGYLRDFVFDWALIEPDAMSRLCKRTSKEVSELEEGRCVSHSSAEDETSTCAPTSSSPTVCDSSHSHVLVYAAICA
jgi:serine/threonine protein kinase